MEILPITTINHPAIISRACAVLAAGGLVIFPTETTYGAGVDATDQAAVDKLLAYKSRREGKPLSIAVPDQESAQKYVMWNEQAQQLAAQFLPGPVTIVATSKHMVAEGVASEFGTLGIRIPDYPFMLELLSAYGKPITATSANGSGEKRPYTLDDIFNNLSEKQKSLIDLVLDAGELPHNPPSTVIDTTLSTPVTLRQGEVTLEAPTTFHNGDKNAVDEKSALTAAKQSTPATLELISHSESETKSIAGRMLLKNWNQVQTSGFVIGLDGPLGAGKTIFTKGIAEFLQISDRLTSPTYTYIEEYNFQRHQTTGKLYHLDMWKVDSKELFEKLEVSSVLAPKSIIVIEWWSQIAPYFESQRIAKNIPLLHVTMTDQGSQRLLTIQEKTDSAQ